jgi:hypothetical protein
MMGIQQEAMLSELTWKRNKEGFIVVREESEVDREEARVA